MLPISDELKTIYKNDLLPIVSTLAHKVLVIYFPSIELTITNDQLVMDSFELSESICSDEDLTIGSCEASQIKFTVADVSQDLTGLEFTVVQSIGGYTVPFGTYKVDSAKKQSDLRFKDVIAYDTMKKFDVDVSVWYNSLTFPISVKNMRISLCNHLGVEYEDQTLINDGVMLEKTINPSVLLGRDIETRLCELNGGFGHFTRSNKFKIIQLTGLGLYPSETLYPSEDLFPAEAGEILAAGYKSIDYEEYIVEPITKLQIRQEDGDSGVVVGIDGNTYIISENFLLYGKTGAELEVVANNILLQIKNKYYRPHNTTMIGLPYLEVGDSISIITTTDVIESFIFSRTLRGIQALEDEISATGNQFRANNASLSTQIEQLKGRTLMIIKSVDGLSVSLYELESDTSTIFALMQGEIELKVDADDVITAINLVPGTATIKATKIALEGLVTINGNFKVLADGKIEAVGGRFSGIIEASVVNGVQVNGGNINGTIIRSNFDELFPNEAYAIIDRGELSFYANGNQLFMKLSESGIRGYIQEGTGRELIIRPSTSEIEARAIYTDYLTTPYLNGKTPITSGNIGSQNVNYAASAGTATNAVSAGSAVTASQTTGSSGTYVYVSINGNFRPGYSNQGSCGTVDGLFTAFYGSSSTITTSDERLKDHIAELDDRYINLFYKLIPKSFTLNSGESGRTHVGFIAQDVERALPECGLTSMDFAGFIKSPVYTVLKADGTPDMRYNPTDYMYMLRYEEFISLTTRAVQLQNERLSNQDERLLKQEDRILAIEKKIELMLAKEGVTNGQGIQ